MSSTPLGLTRKEKNATDLSAQTLQKGGNR
jgi:hypothetical protein